MLKKLGITSINTTSNVVGIGGNFPVHVTSIESLKVVKGKTELAEFTNMRVCVSAQDDNVPFVLLGRDSIFLKFSIRFDTLKQELHLLKPKL